MEDIRDILKNIIDDIVVKYPRKHNICFILLNKIFIGLITEPKNLNFRRINTKNKILEENVFSIPEIADFLTFSGYTLSNTEFNKEYIFQWDTYENVNEAIKLIKDLLDKNTNKTNKVIVRQLDSTNGMAKAFSSILFNEQVNEIWSTSVCVFGNEYYLDNEEHNINFRVIKEVENKEKIKEVDYGETNITIQEFHKYLKDMNYKYNKDNYDAITNNSTHFTNDCIYYLTRTNLPTQITNQFNQIFKINLRPFIMASKEYDSMFRKKTQNGIIKLIKDFYYTTKEGKKYEILLGISKDDKLCIQAKENKYLINSYYKKEYNLDELKNLNEIFKSYTQMIDACIGVKRILENKAPSITEGKENNKCYLGLESESLLYKFDMELYKIVVPFPEDVELVNFKRYPNFRFTKQLTNNTYSQYHLDSQITSFISTLNESILLYMGSRNELFIHNINNDTEKLMKLTNFEERICNIIKYYFDPTYKRDLVIISSNGFSKSIVELVDFSRLSILFVLDSQKLDSSFSAHASLVFTSSGEINIVTVQCYSKIKIWNLKGELQKTRSNNRLVNYSNTYYISTGDKYYIILCVYEKVVAYDLDNLDNEIVFQDKIINKYSSHNSFIIYEYKDKVKLIESISYNLNGSGAVVVWDFLSGKLTSIIDCGTGLFGISFWNESYIITAGFDQTIKVVSLKEGKVINSLKLHKREVVTVRKILLQEGQNNIECLLSYGWDGIKFWKSAN